MQDHSGTVNVNRPRLRLTYAPSSPSVHVVTVERIDAADWPPESDVAYSCEDCGRPLPDFPSVQCPDHWGAAATVGYVGVRVGGDVEIVMTTSAIEGRRQLHIAEQFERVGRLDSAATYREWAMEAFGPPANPWRGFGLNAREYGWHAPRSRA